MEKNERRNEKNKFKKYNSRCAKLPAITALKSTFLHFKARPLRSPSFISRFLEWHSNGIKLKKEKSQEVENINGKIYFRHFLSQNNWKHIIRSERV